MKRKPAEINQEFEKEFCVGIASAEERKEKALEYLKTLNVDKSYVDLYERENVVFSFQGDIAIAVEPNSFIENKIKEIEKEYDCTIFAVVNSYIYGMRMYSLLIVSGYREDWEYNLSKLGDSDFRCLAYFLNTDDERLSEMGNVYLRNVKGLVRVG